MMLNTTTDSAGMVTTKIIAARALTAKAQTMAPTTTKGLRKNSRRNMFSPPCTRLMSLVIRVMRVEVPMVSISEKPRDWMWANSACRRAVA